MFGYGHRGGCHGDSQRPHCWLWYPCVVFVLADFHLPAWLLVQLHGDVRHVVGLGMLIDGAIVVTEYADHKMTEGFGSRDAYLAAAKRACFGLLRRPLLPLWPRSYP